MGRDKYGQRMEQLNGGNKRKMEEESMKEVKLVAEGNKKRISNKE